MLAQPDLAALLVTLRDNGVRRYRDGGVEIELAPRAAAAVERVEAPSPPARNETAADRFDRLARENLSPDA